jgi:hypothetical protein
MLAELCANAERRAAYPCQDHRHCGDQLQLQAPEYQASRCGRTALGAQKVDPLLRGRHGYHFLRRSERVRPRANRGRSNGKYLSILFQNLILSIFFMDLHLSRIE